MKILFSPIHYILDAQHTGSEFSWSYMIYKHFHESREFSSTFVTGGTRGIQDKSVHNLVCMNPAKINSGIANVMNFYLRLFGYMIKHNLTAKHDCIHHVLPFYTGHSINIAPFISKKPFIVGPIQPGLAIQDSDIDTNDARGKKKDSFPLNDIVHRILLAIIRPILAIASVSTLKNADALICVDVKTKNLLMLKGVAKEKIHVIPPGIDAYRFKMTKANPFSPTLKILTVCYLYKRKRVDLIISAIADVIAQGHDVHLTIVGDGTQKESLEKQARDLSLQHVITFKGHVSQAELPKIYSENSLFVHMSQAEGFSVASMEAQACGLGVISSAVGGFDTLVKNDYTGYLVNIDDSKALADKIVHLCTNRSKLKKMGIQARRTIIEKYDWETSIMPQYEVIYRQFSSSGDVQ